MPRPSVILTGALLLACVSARSHAPTEVPSEAAGLIAGPDGSLVVVASLDHGEYAGGIDQDVWLGRLHR